MKLQIITSTSGVKFPYGLLNAENSKFVSENVNKTFTYVKRNMNYYTLENGMLVHVYNAFEMD